MMTFSESYNAITMDVAYNETHQHSREHLLDALCHYYNGDSST